MKIFNTLSKQVETIHNISEESFFGVYACGPTVYDHTHIGHIRKYLMDDVLLRVLKKSGFPVKHVMNITDVGHLVSDGDTGEDKLERAAKRESQSAWDIAKKYEEEFFEAMNRMGLRPPDVSPRATEHIPQQIEVIQKLENNGFTYEIPADGIYFDVSKDPTYGELAHLRLDQQKAGARVDVEGKKNPADFALWKFSPKDEKRQMEWDSPWGKGFPGWHIECSAMSMEYLGEQFALHTGGIDHIPVHHTNEIAQSENATGKRPFVRYWIHHNFVLVDGEKMSKSKGNFYRLEDLEAKGFSPMALKLLYLGAHYRDEINFTWESLAGAQKGYERLQRQVSLLLQEANLESWSEVPEWDTGSSSAELQDIYSQFMEYLQDDLKTAQALALVWKTLKLKNPDILPLLKEMLETFGLSLDEV